MMVAVVSAVLSAGVTYMHLAGSGRQLAGFIEGACITCEEESCLWWWVDWLPVPSRASYPTR